MADVETTKLRKKVKEYPLKTSDEVAKLFKTDFVNGLSESEVNKIHQNFS